MYRIALLCSFLVMITLSASWAQETPEKPETAPAADQPAPTKAAQITGKEDRFTLTVPASWHHSTYDDPSTKPNASVILRGGLNDENTKPTDNFNFWWYEGEETLAMGIASFHRLALTWDADIQALYAGIDKATLPEGVQVTPVQTGKFVGLMGGGVVETTSYVAVVVIPQGRVAYMGTICGPQASVTAQWPVFMSLLSSLSASELKPAALADLFPEVAAAAAGQPAAAADEKKPEEKPAE